MRRWPGSKPCWCGRAARFAPGFRHRSRGRTGMGGRMMRRGNFHRMLYVHGARLQRWPAAERRSAEQLLAADADARAARDEVRRLEVLLDRYAPTIDERVAGRILHRLARLPERRRPTA